MFRKRHGMSFTQKDATIAKGCRPVGATTGSKSTAPLPSGLVQLSGFIFHLSSFSPPPLHRALLFDPTLATVA